MDSMDSKQQAVLRALVYSDIFSFPLTLQEIIRYLPEATSMSEAGYTRVLRSLYPLISEQHGYFYLAGRARIISVREKGILAAQQKLALAEKTARILSHIPTIRFIGLSGSVATGTARRGDDIDFFIVAKKNTVFFTRFSILCILELLGKRRKRLTTDAGDTICVNFLIDETQLRFSETRHDLYTAREIAQLLPLFDRDNTYKQFLRANHWLKRLLPQTRARKVTFSEANPGRLFRLWEVLFSLPLLEVIVRNIQSRLIARHRTTETVSVHTLAFHPHDYRYQTLRRYERKTRKFEAILRKNEVKPTRNYVDKERNIFYTA